MLDNRSAYANILAYNPAIELLNANVAMLYICETKTTNAGVASS